MDVYHLLASGYGELGWWPADSPFEVCVGAILTQNTAWSNVEKAIRNLKQANALTIEGLNRRDEVQLAELIRPSGYFNVKSRRLKDFVGWIYGCFNGSLELMFAADWQQVRNELLKVRGIGPETCDSILLYAGNKPTFVVDAYTRRLFYRLGLLPEKAGYDATRAFLMERLPPEVGLFNNFHAVIVEHCKRSCKVRPLCDGCILRKCCIQNSVTRAEVSL